MGSFRKTSREMTRTVLAIFCVSVTVTYVYGMSYGSDPMAYEQHLPIPIVRRQVIRIKNKLWRWRKNTIARDNLTKDQDKQMTEFIKLTIAKMEQDLTIPYALDEAIKRGQLRSCDETTRCGEPFDFAAIWGYGCYCFFGKNAGKGSGKPRNQVDKLCKNLQFCYRCVTIDSWFNADETCRPGEQTYVVNSNHETEGEKIMTECMVGNDDDCSINTCCCETKFVADLIELFWDGYIFEPEYKHQPEGPFSWDLNCYVKPATKVLSCCGEYPERFPYDIDAYECCEDGNIVKQGMC